MLDKLLRRLHLRPEEERETEGERAHEREADARSFMVDGKGIAPDGGLIEVDESDLERPSFEDPAS
jgi:hypothetical protein